MIDQLVAWADAQQGRFFTVGYHTQLQWEVVLFLGPEETHPDMGAGRSLTAVGTTLTSTTDTALTIATGGTR